jgi:hypothetical protein
MTMKMQTIAEPSTSTTMLLPKVTLQKFADEVTEDWRKSVASVIGVGQRLIGIKAKVPPGQFGWMFKVKGQPHPQAVDHPIPFSQNMAERLMAIAEHPILTDSARWAELPSSWRTLSVLRPLPHDKLEMLLAGGIVCPELTRNEAEALLYAIKKYPNFSVIVAQKVMSLVRREITTSRPCQCSYCGHAHYEKRSKSKAGPKDPNNGTGTA